MRQTSQEIVLDKSQTRREARTESHGSLRIKIAGLPGNGWPGFYFEAEGGGVAKELRLRHQLGLNPEFLRPNQSNKTMGSREFMNPDLLTEKKE
jgi:hypothetical protein